MKDAFSIIGLVAVSFLVFLGVSLIGEQALVNGNLDEESINVLAVYDDRVSDFQANFTQVRNQTQALEDYEPDANLLDQFIKEFESAKDTFTQFKNAIKLVYNIPDIMVMSLPFVDEVDLGIYRDIFWFLITITLAIIGYNAVFNRRISK